MHYLVTNQMQHVNMTTRSSAVVKIGRPYRLYPKASVRLPVV